jgi:hypothetical protein
MFPTGLPTRGWLIMRQAMQSIGTIGSVILLLLGTAGAHAQFTSDSLPLATSYGSGVHAFFSGDFARSFSDLTDAIEGGTADPRAWYFRGLAASRMGRFDEAEADFREGSDRELATVGSWPVSRSLERVQGAERLRLERYRTRARVAALARDQALIRRRYVEIEEAQADVLRKRRPIPPATGADDAFAAPVEQVPGPAASDAAEPVEPEPPTEPPEPAAESEGVSAPTAEAEPFGADSGPKAEAEAPEGDAPAESPAVELEQ